MTIRHEIDVEISDNCPICGEKISTLELLEFRNSRVARQMAELECDDCEIMWTRYVTAEFSVDVELE